MYDLQGFIIGGGVLRIDENNFIQQLKNKNVKALEYMVDNYSELIYKVVYSVLKDTNIDECVNDIYMAVWRNIESFNSGKGTFKSWLIAVSKYKAIDYKRAINKNPNMGSIEDYVLTSENTIEDSIISKENKSEILCAINEMKPIDKEIFIRRYFICDDIMDIAKDLNINRSTVDNRLSRGRKFLKERLIALKEGVV